MSCSLCPLPTQQYCAHLIFPFLSFFFFKLGLFPSPPPPHDPPLDSFFFLFSPIRVFYFLFRTSIENHQCYITLKQTNIKALDSCTTQICTCSFIPLSFLISYYYLFIIIILLFGGGVGCICVIISSVTS